MLPGMNTFFCHALSTTLHRDVPRIPGGSAANVMKGVANLSAGQVCCKIMGMVGTDSTAEAYRRMLQQQGVQPVLLVSHTASCSKTSAAAAAATTTHCTMDTSE